MLAVTDARHPDPVDLRRPGDAPQGRVRQLRAGGAVGRRERRHQRPRPGQPARAGRRWCSAPSTTPRSCTTGSAGPRPVNDPVTGQQLGVIDLSTTWDRTHPIGLATARVMARLIETGDAAVQRAPRAGRRPRRRTSRASTLRLLGTAEAHLDGRRLLLNRRQTEIAGPAGDEPRRGLARAPARPASTATRAVTLSTLKAEVSHLRSALGGQLASRPYRLTMPITTDVDAVLAAARHGDVARCAGGVRRRPDAGHQLAGPRRAGRVRRGRRPRGPARRPAARGRGPLQRARAVRRRGASRSASPTSATAPTPRSPCSRAAWPSPAAEPLRGRSPLWTTARVVPAV